MLIWLTCAAAAQQTSPAPFNAAAYRVGERLTYNVNYSQFVSAAHIELLVGGRGKFFGQDGIQLKAHVETTGVVNVALLSLNNDYTTYVFPESGLPYRAQQVVREAGRTSEASLDYNQPAGTDAIPPRLPVIDSSGIYDLLSALYRMRAMPLALGSSYLTSVRNEAEEYHAEVKVTGKQLIKTSVGSFNALVARVNIKGGPDYNLRVYFSDDEWHVPVLVTAKHNGADIRAELAGSALTPGATTQQTRPTVEPATVIRPANVIISQPAAAANLDLPFKVGEQLNYQVYLANGRQPVGSLTFAVKSRGRYFNRDGLQFVANAQSGVPVFPVRDQITSYVDPATLLPFRTEISFAEGRYRSVRSYNIDQNRGAATSDNNRERVEIPVGTHDLLSALYAIRTFDLTIQKQNAISIMAVRQPRALLIRAQRRETLELNGQQIPAIMLVLNTDDPQPDRLQIRIWVGDDARRLPLRLTAVTELGPVRADLAIAPVTSH